MKINSKQKLSKKDTLKKVEERQKKGNPELLLPGIKKSLIFFSGYICYYFCFFRQPESKQITENENEEG